MFEKLYFVVFCPENGTISLDEVVRVVCTRGIKGNMEMQEELEEALKVGDL